MRTVRRLLYFHFRVEIEGNRVTAAGTKSNDRRLYRDRLCPLGLRLVKGKNHSGDAVVCCRLDLIDVTEQQGVALEYRAPWVLDSRRKLRCHQIACLRRAGVDCG